MCVCALFCVRNQLLVERAGNAELLLIFCTQHRSGKTILLLTLEAPSGTRHQTGGTQYHSQHPTLPTVGVARCLGSPTCHRENNSSLVRILWQIHGRGHKTGCYGCDYACYWLRCGQVCCSKFTEQQIRATSAVQGHTSLAGHKYINSKVP